MREPYAIIDDVDEIQTILAGKEFIPWVAGKEGEK